MYKGPISDFLPKMNRIILMLAVGGPAPDRQNVKVQFFMGASIASFRAVGVERRMSRGLNFYCVVFLLCSMYAFDMEVLCAIVHI